MGFHCKKKQKTDDGCFYQNKVLSFNISTLAMNIHVDNNMLEYMFYFHILIIFTNTVNVKS